MVSKWEKEFESNWLYGLMSEDQRVRLWKWLKPFIQSLVEQTRKEEREKIHEFIRKQPDLRTEGIYKRIDAHQLICFIQSLS